MKFELDTYNRNTPDQELLDDLIKVAQELGKYKVTIDEYNEKGKFHSTTLTRRFGNWFDTLEKAGLKKTRNLNLTNEELFENIEQVWLKFGRQPRYQEMIKPVSHLVQGLMKIGLERGEKHLKSLLSLLIMAKLKQQKRYKRNRKSFHVTKPKEILIGG